MNYYLGIYKNGYCGCDEESLWSGPEDYDEMMKIFEDSVDSYYGFYYPDERFIDIYRDDYDTEEEYEEALEEEEETYCENVLCYSTFEEITKEQYEEYKEWGYPVAYCRVEDLKESD